MAASWSQRFHDLTPDAQSILRAYAVLGRVPMSRHTAAAVLASPLSRVDEIFAVLADAGWGEVTDGPADPDGPSDHPVDVLLEVDGDCSAFLYRLVRQTSVDGVHAIITAVGASVENLLTSGVPLSSGMRTNVLGLLSAANLHELPQVALKVVTAAWTAFSSSPSESDTNDSDTDLDTDLDWWRGVAEEGEKAASRTRQPRLLAHLLEHSARLYLAAGNWQDAEIAWIRASYLMNRLGDDDEYDRYLELLAATYHDADQPTAFVTTLEELADRYRRDGKPEQEAWSLTRIGNTLLGTGQFVSAIRHFEQADRLLADLPETNDLLVRRAEILSDMGRAHVGLNAINSARTCYRDALVLVVDVDQQAEQRVRDLQASLPDQQP